MSRSHCTFWVTSPTFEVRLRNSCTDKSGSSAGAFALTDIEEEPGEHGHAGDEEQRHRGGVVVGREDAGDEQTEPDGGQDGAHDVEVSSGIGRDRIDESSAEEEDDHDDGDLKEERDSPADRRRDDAADERTGRGADAAHPADDAERSGT